MLEQRKTNFAGFLYVWMAKNVGHKYQRINRAHTIHHHTSNSLWFFPPFLLAFVRAPNNTRDCGLSLCCTMITSTIFLLAIHVFFSCTIIHFSASIFIWICKQMNSQSIICVTKKANKTAQTKWKQKNHEKHTETNKNGDREAKHLRNALKIQNGFI